MIQEDRRWRKPNPASIDLGFPETRLEFLPVAAGILFRHRAELHKRLMVFALMPLVLESLLHLNGTLVGRVPLSRGALAIGFLVIGLAVHFIPAVHDKLTRGRIHRASI